MLSISLQTKGDLRLREYAKYIKNDKNFGVDSVAINKVIKTETKKLTGKTAVSGTVQKRDNTLDNNKQLKEMLNNSIDRVNQVEVGLKRAKEIYDDLKVRYDDLAEEKENLQHKNDKYEIDFKECKDINESLNNERFELNNRIRKQEWQIKMLVGLLDETLRRF